MLIGEKIFFYRKKLNYSQEKLAEILNVTRQTISNWETNQTVPDAYQLKDLTNALEVSIDEFMNNSPKMINDIIWGKVLQILESKLNHLSYSTWFSDVILLNVEDNEITLLVPMKVHQRFLYFASKSPFHNHCHIKAKLKK